MRVPYPHKRYTRRDLFVDGVSIAAGFAITGLILFAVFGG